MRIKGLADHQSMQRLRWEWARCRDSVGGWNPLYRFISFLPHQKSAHSDPAGILMAATHKCAVSYRVRSIASEGWAGVGRGWPANQHTDEPGDAAVPVFPSDVLARLSKARHRSCQVSGSKVVLLSRRLDLGR
jgi:hypothetical protein